MDARILRSARCAQGLTRQAIEEKTRLSPRVIAAIEEGRFDRLPGGIYARAYVRTYAHAVGIEDPTLIQSILEVLPTVDVNLEEIVKCRKTPGDGRRRYRAAAAVDGAVVSGISAAGVLMCAGVTGAGAWGVLDFCVAFLALTVPTVILYFSLLGATGVGTAGPRLLRIDLVPRLKGPVNGGELLHRMHGYVRSEALALLTGRVAFDPHAAVHSGAGRS